MVFSRFFVFFALFAFASAGRILEEADPCIDGTATLRETAEYANATEALFLAFDDFEANSTGVCVMVDGRSEWYVFSNEICVFPCKVPCKSHFLCCHRRVYSKGALPAEASSAYEASCTAMDGIVITVSNVRVVCDFPDTDNIYTVIETYYDCVASVCDEESDAVGDFEKALLKALDKHKEGDKTYCFVLDGESGAFSAFSVVTVLISLAAVLVF